MLRTTLTSQSMCSDSPSELGVLCIGSGFTVAPSSAAHYEYGAFTEACSEHPKEKREGILGVIRLDSTKENNVYDARSRIREYHVRNAIAVGITVRIL